MEPRDLSYEDCVKQYEKAQTLYSRNNYQAARRRLDLCLAQFPHHADARLLRIQVNKKLKQPVMVCADLNELRKYGVGQADTVECADCPNDIQWWRNNPLFSSTDPEVMNAEDAESPPIFPEGEDELRRAVSSHIVYPLDCHEMGVMGTIHVTFIVEKDGKVSNVAIVSGVPSGSSLSMESYKSIVHLNNFTPGMQDGKPVRTRLTVPVKFVLK